MQIWNDRQHNMTVEVMIMIGMMLDDDDGHDDGDNDV
jgi:hypothetical protein